MSKPNQRRRKPAQNTQRSLRQSKSSGGTRLNIDRLERTADRDPSNCQLALQLVAAYEQAGRTLEALKLLDRMIGSNQADADTWKTTGRLLMQIRETAQAIGAYRNSIELRADDPESRHEFARALYSIGNVEEAAQQLEMATTLCDEIDPWLALATLAPSNPRYRNEEVLRIRQKLASLLSTVQRKCQAVSAVNNPLPRIGYLSSWFDKENYNKPVWALINHHDRAKFEIHLFSDSPAESGIPGYRKDPRDHVHQTGVLDNHQLAIAIASAQIDLLVDLNAFSEPKRLGLFTTAPAPRTAAWFNMYATSGLPGIQYIIGDAVTVRCDEESWFSEQVLRLPQSYLSFQVTHSTPPIVDPPCCSTPDFTFGSLVTQYKLNRDVMDDWAEILNRVPASRLLLANVELDSVQNRESVKENFLSRGVAASQLLFRGRAKHYEFLQYYDQIDLALDAFPYNGGTTTMEAIWQGVPVITFDGDRWASRTSASLLSQTHLNAFIAADRQDAIDIAVRTATSATVCEDLRQLRHNMRSALQRSTVYDAQSFAAAMESIYGHIMAAPIPNSARPG